MDTMWTKYDHTSWLIAGDEVLFSQFCGKKMNGKIGVFVRRLTKNVLIQVDGKNWRCSPTMIDKWRKGKASNLQYESESTTSVKTSATALVDECEVGDVVLMHRGGHTFDIVEILSLNGAKVRCKALNGRSAGNTYGYKSAWYVQKLNKERLVA